MTASASASASASACVPRPALHRRWCAPRPPSTDGTAASEERLAWWWWCPCVLVDLAGMRNTNSVLTDACRIADADAAALLPPCAWPSPFSWWRMANREGSGPAGRGGMLHLHLLDFKGLSLAPPIPPRWPCRCSPLTRISSTALGASYRPCSRHHSRPYQRMRHWGLVPKTQNFTRFVITSNLTAHA